MAVLVMGWLAVAAGIVCGESPDPSEAEATDPVALRFPPEDVRVSVRDVSVSDLGRIRRVAESGLSYLKDAQQPSGAIGSRYSVAVTSLTGLAVLGAGYLPDQAPYGEMLRGCLRYLTVSARNGFITEAGDSESRMHGHCYAVLFLCELLGSLPPQMEKEARDVIRRGIRVIESAQSGQGGWYYTVRPAPREDEASVTVCALQALRAARNTGFAVDSLRVDRAIRYVESCQRLPEGAFAYSSGDRGRTSFALSVAALSTLNAAGVYESEHFRRGIEYVQRSLDSVSTPWHAAQKPFDYYGNLYAAQVFYQRGGPLWARWFPGVSAYLFEKQRPDGSWTNEYGDAYATAVAVLILEVPLGYLPMFQR